MKELTLKQFITYFKEDRRAEKKFCFILGAGASKSSGIPTGYELVQEWVADLMKSDEEFTKWLSDERINSDDYASHYSKIFDKRYPINKKDGYAFLEEKMEGKEPSCGYSFLAQILAKGKHNIVITTNFDSLTEDALFIYTNKKPLVIGHASLAGYISSNSTRPLVVKIHNDLLLSPKSSEKEVSDLDKSFTNNLKDVFKYYTPLVIGYGGNDGSLMDFLGALEHIGEGIFWFYIEEEKPKQSIVELLREKNGHFIPIKGFDDLMIQLGDALELEKLDSTIENIAKNRADRYRKQIETITKEKATDNETKQAMANITDRGKRTWWSYELMARKEENPEKINEIYLQGLKEFSNSPELYGNYAIFLNHIRKDYDSAEKYYRKALEIEPNAADFNGNYALFLHKCIKDYESAEKYYLKSLEIEPNAADFNGNYALFLYEIKKDYEGSEKYFRKSLEVDPEQAYNCNNFALFLVSVKKDYKSAEAYYKKALEIAPDDANYNGNYAIFLHKDIKDYDSAEKYYLKALDIDPENYNNNGCYAIFLSDIRKDYIDADKYYQKSLEIEPNAVEFNENYALFLSDIKRNYDCAGKYYQKALVLNPNDANIYGNYAKHLIVQNKKEDAIQYIINAFDLNNGENEELELELWFYCYAVYPKKYPESKTKIEELLAKGVRSEYWDLSGVLKIAEKDNHPDYSKLVDYARMISEISK
jgi:tetratricopeptide (TPR) repeat protein